MSALSQVVAQDKRPLGLLLGAGCPLAIADPDDSTKPLIPDVAGLTRVVVGQLTEEGGAHHDSFLTLVKSLTDDGTTTPTVEEMLTRTRSLADVAGRGATTVRDLSRDQLVSLDTAICSIIEQAVDRQLPETRTPYDEVAVWAGSARRAYPVEIFTPNYDLLCEQALERARVPYFDGFSGSVAPFFDLASLEADLLPANWARLWKVHGSINWRARDDGSVYRTQQATSDVRRMIYPSHLKFDQSGMMPYVALLERLRRYLRTPSAILLTVGYSYRDDHINAALLEGLRSNSSAAVFALMHGALEAVETASALGAMQSNLIVLAADGAVVGRNRARWVIETQPAPFGGIAPEGAKEDEQPFRLGDFRAFGEFLAQQAGNRSRSGD